MNKGTFQTPRSLGNVSEIRIQALKIRSIGSEDEISAVIQEGEEIGGVFVVSVTKDITIKTSSLPVVARKVVEGLIKLLLQTYIAREGYDNVTVT